MQSFADKQTAPTCWKTLTHVRSHREDGLVNEQHSTCAQSTRTDLLLLPPTVFIYKLK